MEPGEGLVTDMRAVRKDYFLDHDHSAYVDQWDWERAITAEQRTLAHPHRDGARDLARDPLGRGARARPLPAAPRPSLPEPPRRARRSSTPRTCSPSTPSSPRKQRETAFLQEHPAAFIYGIGWTLADGYPHELRAADYDDWATETVSADGRPMHGLNGDILVWNPVTRRRHELSSMGVRVTKESLVQQLELTGQLGFLELPYHRAILEDRIPLSIGGGIGQSRVTMLLLRKAHLGEVSVTVWPDVLKKMCAARNIDVLE